MLVGLGFMTPFVLQAIRDYRIAKVYRPVECEITGERTVTRSSSSQLGGRWYTRDDSHREFTWAYEINAHPYRGEGYDNHAGIMADPQETGNLYKGIKVQGWYDPAAPEKSVLVRHFRPKFYLGALIPGSFVLIAGMMLMGVLRRKPQRIKLNISEGERLKVRLQPAMSTKGIMGCLGMLVALLGLFMFLVLPRISISTVGPSLIGGKGWAYLVCLAIEGFLIYHLLRAFRASRVPDPIVEIEQESIAPGQTSRLYICQPGPAELTALEVAIVCEKVGQSGTRKAYKHVVFERQTLRIGTSEEFNETFSIPEKASPSAKTVQTATNWFIRIRRELPNAISYDTDYPFKVSARQSRIQK